MDQSPASKSNQISKSKQSIDFALGKVTSLEIICLQTPQQPDEDLFDFDEENPKARKVVLKDNAVLAITKDDKFCFLKDQFDKDPKVGAVLQKIKQIFCSFTVFQNYYLLKPIKHPIAKRVWIDIESFPTKLFPVRKNDILRMGLKTLKVKQFITHDQTIANQSTLDQISSKRQVYGIEQVRNQNQAERMCRMCKSKGIVKNPIVVACKCKGDQKYVHIKCLRDFFTSKLISKINQHRYTVRQNHINCQKCNSKIKSEYQIDQKIIKAFQIPIPNLPCIVFEHRNLQQYNKFQLLIEVISMSKIKSMCIGSSINSHICLQNQTTLEDSHCQIVYDRESKRFLLTDSNSQYGTFLLLRGNLKIRPHHGNIRVQVGNVLLDMLAKRQNTNTKIANFDESNQIIDYAIEHNNLQESIFS